MLYKVTPMLTPVEKQKPLREAEGTPKEPRKRRKSAVYDADGHEVLITMMCLKCRSMKPLAMFGLRKMADGAIRNQPWCRTCRSGAGTKKPRSEQVEAPAEAVTVATPAELASPSAPEVETVVDAAPEVAPVEPALTVDDAAVLPA